MLRKWWRYIKAWFRSASDSAMKPEIEIQMAMDEAKKVIRRIGQSAVGQCLSPITALADAGLESREEPIGDIHRLEVFR